MASSRGGGFDERIGQDVRRAAIADRVVRSRHGICYFSEPAPAGVGHRYVDNPNVIFEAGMLHALINAPDAPPSGWIPVREDDSPPAPFDFADQRIERVPRDQQGQVLEDRFRAQMHRTTRASRPANLPVGACVIVGRRPTPTRWSSGRPAR